MAPKQTPSQTVGPYFSYGMAPKAYGFSNPNTADRFLAGDDTAGERIQLRGQVFDGDGQPVTDALIEIWQANAHGRYNHPADDRQDNQLDPDFSGFGRCGTGADGADGFEFATVKPGAPEPGQAPHINVVVFARGLLNHLYTRVYFADEADANASDPVLSSIGPERRDTLVAKRSEGAGGRVVYRFDIHLQGPRETVFFDL